MCTPPPLWFAVHILISNAAGFINTFANAVGLQRWGYKYYFVFVVWDVCASVLWFLFGVETRGRTLEELDEIFGQPWPAMASARGICVPVRDRGSREVIAVANPGYICRALRNNRSSVPSLRLPSTFPQAERRASSSL